MHAKTTLTPKTLRYTYLSAFLYLAAHLLVTQISTHNYPSGFMVLGLGVLRIACCIWFFVRFADSPARWRWLAYGCGALLGNASTQIYVWREIFAPSSEYLSAPASFLTSVSCIPVLVSISSNINRKDPPSVRWIDLVIGLTLGTLFAVQFLSPGSFHSLSDQDTILSENRLIDLEGMFLIVCAALQFLSSDSTEDRRFTYVFFCYMMVSMPVLAFRNRWNVLHPSPTWDLLVDLAPLAFILLAISPTPAWVYNVRTSDRLSYLVRGGSPMFMSFALTLFGMGMSGSHRYIGSAGILLGITGYGLRNAIIQGKLLYTEQSLTLAKQELEMQASRDGLTGIPNRRLFDETLRREWRIAARTGIPLALLMIDVDSFKGFNDTYGHQKGDECLIAVATAIQDSLVRAGDFAARYGGEEFAVILPGPHITAAQVIGERLREAVAVLMIPHTGSRHGFVSISVGAATSDCLGVSDITSLVEASDHALYGAKHGGRNCVKIAGSHPSIIHGNDHLGQQSSKTSIQI